MPVFFNYLLSLWAELDKRGTFSGFLIAFGVDELLIILIVGDVEGFEGV